MDFLRDTIWQFVFGLLGIGIAVFIYLLQRRKKSLSYQVISEAPLLTVREGLEGNIKILYGEKLVPDVHLVVIRILNNGNTPILSSDFEENLQFSFGQKTAILSAEVTDSLPKTFKPAIDVEADHIVLQRTLLNGGDEATIKLLLAGYNNTIECYSRIVGIKDVKRTSESFNLSGMYKSMGIVLFATGAILFSILFYNWSNFRIDFIFSRPIFVFQFVFYIALLFTGLTLLILGYAKNKSLTDIN